MLGGVCLAKEVQHDLAIDQSAAPMVEFGLQAVRCFCARVYVEVKSVL